MYRNNWVITSLRGDNKSYLCQGPNSVFEKTLRLNSPNSVNFRLRSSIDLTDFATLRSVYLLNLISANISLTAKLAPNWPYG